MKKEEKEKTIPFSWYIQKQSEDIRKIFIITDIITAISFTTAFLYLNKINIKNKKI